MADPSEPRPDPKASELAARALWQRERLPPRAGVLGPPEGPVVHGFEGSFAAQESGMLVVQRAVAADVDARAIALSGRRATGALRREDGGPANPENRLEPLLLSLGVWVGGEDGHPFTSKPQPTAVQAVAGRLAHAGVIAVRDVALRICPACAVARDPERIVYQEESGATLLVRFPFPVGDRTVSALVWTDSAWRLLASSALLVHPDLPYVIARYRREGDEELIFTSRSSLDRIRHWLRGAEIEVVEEHPGKHWEGTAYVHPLRHEFPLGGGLEPPAGTLLAATEVTDTGTGIVPLVPGHGGNDAVIAERLGVPGWPLITPKGRFDIMLVHKYAGLELDSGDDFVERDLSESGAVFARLRVRRGVPHCARCGSALIWAPGRAWCLEPSRLPAPTLALYRAMLPHDRPIERLEAVPWPVSEPLKSEDPLAVTLLECSSCDRLDAPGAPGDRCSCGGRRRPVKRRLLPGFESAASEWGALEPFPPADAVRLYVNERRRAPAVVHQLAAMSGVAGTVGDVRLTLLPTAPEEDLAARVVSHGADAVRAALVRAQGSEGRTATFRARCDQERARLDRFAAVARSVVARIDPTALATYAQPIAAFVGELEPEDRAFLARFERMRIQALADYDRGAAPLAYRRLFRFLDNELATYQRWAGPRLALAGGPPAKRTALRALAHVLLQSTLLLAPVAPHTAESVHGALAPRRASVFEETAPGVDRALLDEERAKSWDRWTSAVAALERYRRAAGLPPRSAVPSVVLVLATDAAADAYRAEAPILERLAQVGKIEVGSPASPWTGRKRQLRPVEAEIQRVYSSRASQIIHLLRRASERKIADPGPQGFALMVDGQPTQILPSMLDWVDVLPERVVPTPWRDGEMYVARPTSATAPARPPPPLSVDAFHLVDRIGHRVRQHAGLSRESQVVLVSASGALGPELAGAAPGIAAYLGIRELRVLASDRELPAGLWEFGREHGGARWRFQLAGVAPTPAAAPAARPRQGGERLRPAFSPASIAPGVPNYAEDAQVAHHAAVRALGDELDGLLGRPLIGPSKIGLAWEAGLRSVEDFRTAEWSTLVAIPGFGPPVATALVEKLGGVVPPPPPRVPRIRLIAPGENGGHAPAGPEPLVPPSELPAPPATAPANPAPRLPPLPRPLVAPSPAPFVGAPVAPEPPPAPPIAVPVPPPAPPPEEVGDAPTRPASVEAEPAPVDLDRGESASPSPDLAAESSSPDTPAPYVPPEPGRESTHPVDTPAEPEVPVTADEEGPPQVAPTEITGPEPALPAPQPEVALPPPEVTLEALPSPPPIPALAEPGAAAPGGAPVLGPPESTPASIESPRDLASGGPEPSETPVAPEAELSPAPTEQQPPPDAIPQPPPAAAEGPEPAASVTGSSESPPLAEPRPPTTGELDSPVPAQVPEVLATPFEPAPAPTGAPLAPEGPERPVEAAPPLGSTPTAVPELAAPAPAPTGGIELDLGTSYLPGLERFLDATAAGHLGVCVVRDSPERVRAYAGPRPVEIRWLTNIGRGATLKPTDLEGFAAFLAHSVSQGRATVFFLEGIEYLIRLHGLDRMIAQLTVFDELARAHSARVWLHLNPKLLSPAELERFVATFGPTGTTG